MSTHLMGIGETVSSLRPEFPDVSVSKIRFLESEGLVAPLRTPSGYRKYTPAHVDRIRYVLTMQRDHYLPLKVIADHLDALDRGLTPPEPVDATPQSSLSQTVAPDVGSLDTGARLTPTEVCRESGLSRDDLDQAIALGLLPDAGEFTLDHVEAARALAALRDCGVPVRNARPVYLAVRREVDLCVAVLGQRRSGESPQEYADRAGELAATMVRAHVAVMRSLL
ncbi:MAG: MerR family transcriptional regulator [Actinobacteria bacterium]|nr:MerR family transcriptional regulator [Actinomycetota bacterium]MCB8995879.1 MerR family transcriptional regulator [Actinomycetota bacterium]MCB9415161.1 MerR family transcriptional regulator [Actinomycetota bacterium]MCB9424596.1 MerR family transcriptional regulator [Actinomycetota bacterium]HRY08486.1 MerR family transcriptional regulator [Candidatus Nanopelagicales bacterium]